MTTSPNPRPKEKLMKDLMKDLAEAPPDKRFKMWVDSDLGSVSSGDQDVQDLCMHEVDLAMDMARLMRVSNIVEMPGSIDPRLLVDMAISGVMGIVQGIDRLLMHVVELNERQERIEALLQTLAP